MKRITCVVAALGLLVGACGSGDDEPAADEAPADEAAADEPAADQPAADEAAADEPAADEPAADEPAAEDPPADDSSDDDDGNSMEIRSMDDIPEECREEMANFLREIEPIVSSINWETATLSDFEEIAEDFDRISEDFNTVSAGSGCDDLEFIAENEFELLIEFARDEAPGTVGFFEFFNTLSGAVGLDEGDAGSAGDLQTCEEGIAFVQSLLDNYDSLDQVPAAELMKFGQIGSLFITCTPEQLEFLESDEVTAFLDG